MDVTLHFKVQDLNARYAQAIDDDKLEAWPDFFVEQGRYRITTAENVERGLPLAMIYATSRAMLRDRVRSLRDMLNVYEPQRYVIGAPLIEPGGEGVQAQTGFLVAHHAYRRDRAVRHRAIRDELFSMTARRVFREDRDPRQPAGRRAAGDPAVASAPSIYCRLPRHVRARRLAHAPDRLPLLRAVLVRADLHQRRLHDAGRGGRLAVHDLTNNPLDLGLVGLVQFFH